MINIQEILSILQTNSRPYNAIGHKCSDSHCKYVGHGSTSSLEVRLWLCGVVAS